jgi:hypothetical protein
MCLQNDEEELARALALSLQNSPVVPELQPSAIPSSATLPTSATEGVPAVPILPAPIDTNSSVDSSSTGTTASMPSAPAVSDAELFDLTLSTAITIIRHTQALTTSIVNLLVTLCKSAQRSSQHQPLSQLEELCKALMRQATSPEDPDTLLSGEKGIQLGNVLNAIAILAHKLPETRPWLVDMRLPHLLLHRLDSELTGASSASSSTTTQQPTNELVSLVVKPSLLILEVRLYFF